MDAIVDIVVAADLDEKVDQNVGNRDNLVQAVSRVNSKYYSSNCIYVDYDFHEVELLDLTGFSKSSKNSTYVLDDSLDTIPKNKDSDLSPCRFATQEEVWEKFRAALLQRLELSSPSMLVAAIGASGSGKSHTLFGSCFEQSSDNPLGLLPMAISFLFNQQDIWQASSIQISAMLVMNEEIVDLCQPDLSHSYHNNMCLSTAIGTAVLPCYTPIATTATEALALVRILLQVANYYLCNTINIYASYQIVFDLKIVSRTNKHYFNLKFVEISTLCPCPGDLSNGPLNRLSGTSLVYHGCKHVQESVKKKPHFTSVPTSCSHTSSASLRIHSCTLSYILQNELYISPDCYLLCCLRADPISYSENKATMEFANNLDSNAEAISQEYRDDDRYKNRDRRSCDVTQVLHQLSLEIEIVRKEFHVAMQSAGRSSAVAENSKRDRGVLPRHKHQDSSIDVFYDRKLKYLMTMHTYIKYAAAIDGDNDSAFEDVKREHNHFNPSGKYSRVEGNKKKKTTASTAGESHQEHIFDHVSMWLLRKGILVYGCNEYMQRSPFLDTGIYSQYSPYTYTIPSSMMESNSSNDPYVEFVCPSNNMSAIYVKAKLRVGATTYVHGSSKGVSCYTEPDPCRSYDGVSHYSPGTKASMAYRRQEIQAEGVQLTEHIHAYNEIHDILPTATVSTTADAGGGGGGGGGIGNGVITMSGLDFTCALMAVFSELYDNVYIEPYRYSTDKPITSVYVNGIAIDCKTQLHDQDIISIGASRLLRLNIPRKPLFDMTSEEEAVMEQLPVYESSITRAMRHLVVEHITMALLNYQELQHSALVNREITGSMLHSEKNPLQSLKTLTPDAEAIAMVIAGIPLLSRARMSEMLSAVTMADYLSHVMFRGLYMAMTVKTMSTTHSASIGESTHNLTIRGNSGTAVDSAAAMIDTGLSFNVCVRGVETTNVSNSFTWCATTFIERYSNMLDLYDVFVGAWCRSDPLWLDLTFPDPPHPSLDPFVDSLDDVLIGTSYLYLDPLQYLLDINDHLPIVDYKGNKVGSIRLSVRCWLDETELYPPYLTIDKEIHIRDSMNRKLILVLSFEGLSNLPIHLCAQTHVYFRFYNHSLGYKTPRHEGVCCNPYYGASVRVDQRISKDFEEYIKMGVLEMEVFGKGRQSEGTVTPVSISVGERLENQIDTNTAHHKQEGEAVVDEDGEEGGMHNGSSDKDSKILRLEEEVEALTTSLAASEKEAATNAKKQAAVLQGLHTQLEELKHKNSQIASELEGIRVRDATVSTNAVTNTSTKSRNVSKKSKGRNDSVKEVSARDGCQIM